MAWRTVPIILLALLVLGVFAFSFYIQPARASGTIYIRADGSVDPPNAPISTVDNVTYTLTGNITSDADGIVVERDDIVVDGAGYTVTGSGSVNGITLTDRNNVTVGNMTIKNFYIGINLDSSSNNVLSGNNVTNNSYGIWPYDSSNNVLSGNNATANNETGIWFDSSSDNNTLSGNDVTANEWDGVWLSSSSGNTLSGNNVTANSYVGIELGYDVGLHYFSDNNVLSGNNVTANNEDGILLESSSNNILSGNNVTANNQYGIRIESSSVHPLTRSSSGNTLSGNVMGGNRYAFGVNGYVLSDYLNSVDASNLVDDRPIYYFVNQSDIMVNADAYPEIGYLAFVNCVNVTVQELNLTGNGQGLLLAFTKDSRITGNNATNCEEGISLSYSSDNDTLSGNNVTNNHNGIVLSSSSNNVLSGNNVTVNNGKGIYLLTPSYLLTSSDNNTLSDNNVANNDAAIELDSSDDNVLSGNNITNSGIGVELVSSSGNSIYHNNFINNTQQAFVSEGYTNTWNGSYPSGGNYWSDYNGTDANHDGIGDTAYIIDANNTDHYPLMVPYVIPEFPSFLILAAFMTAILLTVIVCKRKHILRFRT